MKAKDHPERARQVVKGDSVGYAGLEREPVSRVPCLGVLVAPPRLFCVTSCVLTVSATAFVVPTVASCFDMVVHCHRNNNGHRFVSEILAVGNRVENGIIETYPLFRHIDGELVPVAAEVPSPDKFLRSGYRPSALLDVAPAAKTGASDQAQPKKSRAKTP